MTSTERGLRRHPWNTDFEWPDREAAPAWLTPDQVAQFDAEGYVLVRGALGEAELAPVVEELDRFERKAAAFIAGQDGGRIGIAEEGAITFAPNLAARSDVLAAFSRHPALLGLCADLVGPDVRLYWDQAVYKKPEKPRRFPWHQDNGYRFLEPQAYLTCWVPLVAATEANGCPQVAPGCHRAGTLAHHYVEPLGWECFEAPPVEPVVVEAGVGDVVVFSSLTPHLTGPNTTAEVRKAYIVQYAPEGAEALEGDPRAGAPSGRARQADPGYQYPVLAGGDAVQ